MKQTMITLAVIAALISASAFAVSPSFRTWVGGTYESVAKWTPEAIQANPQGYAKAVKRQLESDLTKLEPTLRTLILRKDTLAKLWKDKSAAVERGQALAEEAAEAISVGNYPANIAGREYNEEQLKSQLGLWLAQIEVKKELVAEIAKVQTDAEKERQNLTINVERTKSQLALLDTRIEIWKSRATTAQGLAMIAEVNAVLEGNQTIIQNDPVRGLDEAIADAERAYGNPSSVGSDKVEAFLAGYAAKKGGNKPVISEPAPSAPIKVEVQKPVVKPVEKPVVKPAVKPQQSQTQSQSQSQSPVKK